MNKKTIHVNIIKDPQERKRYRFGLARWMEIAERLQAGETIKSHSLGELYWDNTEKESLFCDTADCDLLHSSDKKIRGISGCGGCMTEFEGREAFDENPCYETALAVANNIKKALLK